MKLRAAFLALMIGCSAKFGAEDGRGSAVDHGRALYTDPKASQSASNAFACVTCHRADQPAAALSRLDPGAPLAGVAARKSYWGAQRVDLLSAINDCRMFFMDAPRPWTADEEDARAMYAFLVQLPAAGTDPVPFTVVAPVDLPPGDPKRGAAAFELACRSCHGTIHDGAGKLAAFIPALPDFVVGTHAGLAPVDLRLVFISKVRGGAFRGGGSMPPFSREVLADEDLAGIVAFFGLY